MCNAAVSICESGRFGRFYTKSSVELCPHLKSFPLWILPPWWPAASVTTSSPVGAITNGLEVLDEEGSEDMREFAMDLIRKSARQASAKLQFARLAFGAAGIRRRRDRPRRRPGCCHRVYGK
jgi:hypothetical protein